MTLSARILILLTMLSGCAGCTSNERRNVYAETSRDALLVSRTAKCDAIKTTMVIDPRCVRRNGINYNPVEMRIVTIYESYENNRSVCADFYAVDSNLRAIEISANSAGLVSAEANALYLRGKVRLYCGLSGWDQYVDQAIALGLDTGESIQVD